MLARIIFLLLFIGLFGAGSGGVEGKDANSSTKPQELQNNQGFTEPKTSFPYYRSPVQNNQQQKPNGEFLDKNEYNLYNNNINGSETRQLGQKSYDVSTPPLLSQLLPYGGSYPGISTPESFVHHHNYHHNNHLPYQQPGYTGQAYVSAANYPPSPPFLPSASPFKNNYNPDTGYPYKQPIPFQNQVSTYDHPNPYSAPFPSLPQPCQNSRPASYSSTVPYPHHSFPYQVAPGSGYGVPFQQQQSGRASADPMSSMAGIFCARRSTQK